MVPLELVQSYRAMAGRGSILSLYRGRVDGPAAARKAVFAARLRWRWFVTALRQAGWPPANRSALHVSYLSNCPPFGLAPPKGQPKAAVSRACLRPLYCPFCYARQYAVAAYDRLVGLLPAAPGERVLYATETATRLDPDDYPTATAAYEAVAAVVGGPGRRAEVDAAAPIGAVVFHRVRFGVFYNVALDRDDVTSLTVSRTALMVCRKEAKLRVPGGVQLTLTPDPGRRELAGEVARLFRYPAEWYEVPRVAVKLGEFVAKARVFSTFGACRGRTGAAAETSGVTRPVDGETDDGNEEVRVADAGDVVE